MPVPKSSITLHHGDCLDILPTLADSIVDAVVTDPPYGTGQHIRVNGQLQKSKEKWDTWNTDWLDCLCDVPVAFFCPPKRIADGMKYAERYLAWCSKNPLAMKGVSPRYGMQFILARGPFPTNYGLDWFYYRSNISTSNHPHQKPVDVMKWLIETMTIPNATILDPFMGSGTTGVACILTGRNFIGIEIDDNYFHIAEKRIAETQLCLHPNLP